MKKNKTRLSNSIPIKLILRTILTVILVACLVNCSSEKFVQEINFDDLLDESHKINNIIDEGFYKIKGNPSQKYLQIRDASVSNGGNAEISSANEDTGDIEATKNQEWQFTIKKVNPANGRNVYQIRNSNSLKSLDIEERSVLNGGNLQQWSFAQGDNQLWEIVKYNEYWYFINYGSRKVLETNDSGTSDDTNVHQWSYTGESNQQWIVEYQEPE